MSRQRGGSVTGGTGDVKPQLLTASTGLVGAVDDYVTSTISLPVPRFGSRGGRATVFEILSVQFFLSIENIGDSGGTSCGYLSTEQLRVNAATSTLPSLAADIADSRVFAVALRQNFFAVEGGLTVMVPRVIDLTDKNGNGILIATDRIFFTQGSIGDAVVAQSVVKILYRMVNVGVQEYVGIVQSQR